MRNGIFADLNSKFSSTVFFVNRNVHASKNQVQQFFQSIIIMVSNPQLVKKLWLDDRRRRRRHRHRHLSGSSNIWIRLELKPSPKSTSNPLQLSQNPSLTLSLSLFLSLFLSLSQSRLHLFYNIEQPARLPWRAHIMGLDWAKKVTSSRRSQGLRVFQKSSG